MYLSIRGRRLYNAYSETPTKGTIMFNRKPHEPSELELARTRLLREIDTIPPMGQEFDEMMGHVKTLTELIDLEKSEKLSPNTLAITAGNLAIALIVVSYESKHVVTTKLLPFLGKAFK